MLRKTTRLVAATAAGFLLAVAGFQLPVFAMVAYRRTLEADSGPALGWLIIVGLAGGALWVGSRCFAGWFGLVGKVTIGFGLAIGVLALQFFMADPMLDPMLRVIGLSGVVSIVSLAAACIIAQRRADAPA
jgi:hypothetical protein